MIRYLSNVHTQALRGTALLRLDFNTEDDWRLHAGIPTIRFLLKKADRIIILSHRGRPKGIKLLHGVPYGFDRGLSLKSDAHKLQKLLGKSVRFIPDFNFEKIKKMTARAQRGMVFVLENLRFLSGEEKNGAKLGASLASLGDYYVNDAFAVSHRVNASVVAITKFLPSYAGLELEREIKTLSRVLVQPQHPFVVILGGSKAHDKLGVLHRFKNKADAFLVGGGSANTLLMMQGVGVKDSLRDRDHEYTKQLQPVLRYHHLMLPSDWIWRKNKILDIGPKTVTSFVKIIRTARTIFWSGPMGLIEESRYARGNLAVARAIARNSKALSITGGGETVMFLKKHKLDKKIGFISTGGGAMLDFLAGEKLPGIEALK